VLKVRRWRCVRGVGTATVIAAIRALVALLPSIGKEVGAPDPSSPADVARMAFEDVRLTMAEVLSTNSSDHEVVPVDVRATSTESRQRKLRWVRVAYATFPAGLLPAVGAVAAGVSRRQHLNERDHRLETDVGT
jgi:hypothetical protein